MARKSRAEQYNTISQKLRDSARWREDMGYDDLWIRMVDLYRGKHWAATTVTNNDLVAVNLAFSTVNVIAPSVAVNYPKIVVSPNEPEDQDRAAFVEAITNYAWRHHDFRKPFQRSVRDFLIFGHGWLKVGWKFVEQERMLSDEERAVMFDEAVAEANILATEDPALATELPDDEQIAAGIPESAMEVVEDQPFIERISPFDMFIDPEATCIDDAQWICQKVIRPLEEAKKDKRYKASVRKKLSADSRVSPTFAYTDRTIQEEYLTEVDRVAIYEFYNIEENTMAVFSLEADEFLVDPMAMPYAYGHPFVMLRNYDVPDYFYPMGDLESIESLQLELDMTRTQLVNARKRYARKYLFHERSFGPEGREALEADEDGRLVPVVDENKPLSEVVIPMPQTPLSPEVYNMSAIIEQDINTVSGVSEYARGQMPEIRRTATEASIIADAGNARVAEKLAIVELGISECARRVIQVMQQFMTGEQIVRVSARAGADLFVPYTRDDIVGEYDFSVEAGSTQPINDTVRKQQAVALMNAMAPMIGTIIDPAAIARYVLQNAFDIKDPDRYLMQQTPGVPEAEGAVPGSAPQMGGMGGGMQAGMGQIPPQLVNQLRGQMDVELPDLS
tara:strand:+ start:2244 stop:4100 length:1857 start_codon:yes stop_codon:yes gene_type:complete